MIINQSIYAVELHLVNCLRSEKTQLNGKQKSIALICIFIIRFYFINNRYNMAFRLRHLNPKKTLFLLCDIQEKFRPGMPLFDNMVKNADKLAS